jgi:Zn ribbon nucleic-acid-binding protein
VSQPGTHKGFLLQCPFCGAENTIRMDVDRLTSFFCLECDSGFHARDVRKIIDGLKRFLDRLETAPDYPGE